MVGVRGIVARFATTLAAYGLAVQLGLALRDPHISVAFFWPAAGIGAGCIALAGRARNPRASTAAAVAGVFAANVLLNAIAGHTGLTPLWFSVANTAESLAAALTLMAIGQRTPGAARTMTRVVVAGCAGVAVSTPVALLLIPRGPGATVWQLALNWAIPDLAGIVVVSPMLVLGWDVVARGILERAAQTSAFAGLCAATFWLTSGVPIAWLPLPALTWAAMRLGVTWTAAEATTLAVATAVASTHGAGPFAQGDAAPSDDLLRLLVAQGFAATMAFTAITMALVVHHRNDLLFRASMFDPLTGLGNRTLLQARATAAATSRTDDQWTGVLYGDMNDLKSINDTLGHAAGDSVLQTVAKKMQRVAGPEATVARLGGDEFVVLHPALPDADSARALAVRIEAAVSEPVPVAGTTVHPSITIGTAVTDLATPLDDLLADADRSMYVRKMSRQQARQQNRWAGRRSTPRPGVAQPHAPLQDASID